MDDKRINDIVNDLIRLLEEIASSLASIADSLHNINVRMK